MTCDPRALGQILLETTSLDEASLENALTIQQERGGRIGEILINQKMVTEEEVFQALSRQLNVPFWPEIADEGLDLELLRTVPINFCKRHTLLPLKSEADIVQVAVSDPLDLAPMDDLQLLLKKLGERFEIIRKENGSTVKAINLSGLAGGSAAFLLASLYDNFKGNILFVTTDYDSAQNLADDLINIIGEDSIHFFPNR